MRDEDKCPKCDGRVCLGILRGYFVCLNCGYKKIIEDGDETEDDGK